MARKYDNEYKVQAVKLAKEIEGDKAAKKLGIPSGTIYTWLKAAKIGKLECVHIKRVSKIKAKVTIKK